MVDTNSDPKGIDYVIPSNDDASLSIELVLDVITGAIKEGLDERRAEKDKKNDDAKAKTKTPIKKKTDKPVEVEQVDKAKTGEKKKIIIKKKEK